MNVSLSPHPANPPQPAFSAFIQVFGPVILAECTKVLTVVAGSIVARGWLGNRHSEVRRVRSVLVAACGSREQERVKGVTSPSPSRSQRKVAVSSSSTPRCPTMSVESGSSRPSESRGGIAGMKHSLQPQVDRGSRSRLRSSGPRSPRRPWRTPRLFRNPSGSHRTRTGRRVPLSVRRR